VDTDIVDICVIEFADDIPSGFFKGSAYIIDDKTVATSKPGHVLQVVGVLKDKSSTILPGISMGFCRLGEQERQALCVIAENVPGVKGVRDCLTWVEPVSGTVINSPSELIVADCCLMPSQYEGDLCGAFPLGRSYMPHRMFPPPGPYFRAAAGLVFLSTSLLASPARRAIDAAG
jgi:hypothetical protein